MTAIEEEIKKFPTTRYQGSKRKILSWIYEHVKDLPFQTALDAFGGTGSVSYLLKLMGKSVTFNDQLRFNYIIGKALIENATVTLSEQDIENILNLNAGSEKVFIQDTFPNIYYTDEENEWIDNYIHRVNSFFQESNDINEQKKSLAYFALFQSCLTKRPYNLFHRNNLYMRLNDVVRNFGNKTTWERSFDEQVRKFLKEANDSIFAGNLPCYSMNQNALDITNTDFDLVYIDPPYVDQKGDHDTIDYTYCYHFLEGIAKYEEWELMIDYDSKNRRFKKEFFSNDFKRKNVLSTFKLLFEKFRHSIIVVSYKQNGIPSIEEIEGLLKSYKKNVSKYSMHYKYALNRQNGSAAHNREVLFIGT